MGIWLKMGIVALGGALGALGRTGLTAAVASLAGTAIPGEVVGTLIVNMAGCLGMGGARAAVELAGWGSAELNALLFSGFLGAFTTFSTFEADAVTLWRDGERLVAGLYMGGSVVGGIVAFLVGWICVEALVG